MAEWLKALVLKTRDGNVRRFESCPFRQYCSGVGHSMLIGVFFDVLNIMTA